MCYRSATGVGTVTFASFLPTKQGSENKVVSAALLQICPDTKEKVTA
jgi:hypothetical protein